MEKIFEFIRDNLMLAIVLGCSVAVLLISAFSKKLHPEKRNTGDGGESYSSNGSGTTFGPNSVDNPEIGEQDKVVKPHGWFRRQGVSQPVIKRTEEQQRIVDEYFNIRNYETITCVSAYKRYYKTTKMLALIFVIAGLVLAVVGFSSSGFAITEAIKNVWFVIGVIGLIGSVISKIASVVYKNKFEASVRRSIAPMKVLTDAEYEELVDKKIEEMDIAKLGLERLGLDEEQVREINPIVLRDKVIEDDYSFTVLNRSTYSVHSSTQHVTYLYFTDDQLFVYKIQFDMCCNVQQEWASEFFYKDICDVSSYTSRNVLKDYDCEYSTFSFNIIATNSEIGFVLDGNNENISSIQAMKQKIREKKAQ